MIQHKNSIDFSIKEGENNNNHGGPGQQQQHHVEESMRGRTSRNRERGHSEMNSISSKMKRFEHKVLS